MSRSQLNPNAPIWDPLQQQTQPQQQQIPQQIHLETQYGQNNVFCAQQTLLCQPASYHYTPQQQVIINQSYQLYQPQVQYHTPQQQQQLLQRQRPLTPSQQNDPLGTPTGGVQQPIQGPGLSYALQILY